jgi:hypothetical protein
MKQILSTGLSAIALALAAGSAHAQIANGNFNGLAGWSTTGDAASVGGNHLVLTNALDGSDDADGHNRNVSGNAPTLAAGDLENFVGIAPGALDTDASIGAQAMEGSAALQSFSAAAGSRLTFQWNLATTETSTDPSVADVAFIVLDGQLITLANTLAATTATGGGDYVTQTGWMSYDATFASGGTHTIAFGVVDEGSWGDTSALSVTGVGVVSSVPESSSIAMLAAGLGLLGVQARRRRKA